MGKFHNRGNQLQLFPILNKFAMFYVTLTVVRKNLYRLLLKHWEPAMLTSAVKFACSKCGIGDAMNHCLNYRSTLTLSKPCILGIWVALQLSCEPNGKLSNHFGMATQSEKLKFFCSHPSRGGGEELYTQMGFFVQSILADRYIHRRELRLASLESLSSVEHGRH